MKDEIKELKNKIKILEENNKYLEESNKHYNEVILQKIILKSEYLEQVKKEVETYRKYKNEIDNFVRILDKIDEIRDTALDIAEDNYPDLYNEFIKDVYDEDKYQTLIFIRKIIERNLNGL